MKYVGGLVAQQSGERWVILSAVSGTTNILFEINNCIRDGNRKGALENLDRLKAFYKGYINELLDSDSLRAEADLGVTKYFNLINEHIEQDFYSAIEKEILAQGEFISTFLFHKLQKEQGIESRLLSALNFMVLNKNNEPFMERIEARLHSELPQNQGIVTITQGFICRNHKSEIDNLKRGGSDFSASIIGAAISAREVQIWTDIDGMHNNDPRIVKKTKPISFLSFDEAAELAYFGAKVLHPSTILPARKHNIPVRIKNTLDPDASGTLISKVEPGRTSEVRAVAAKDAITAIKIRSSRMLMAYGFLRKVFEVFEKFETPIDMITTSEVAVSLTIDNSSHLHEIVSMLEPLGEVEVDYDLTIICVVGNLVAEDKGKVSTIFNSLSEIPIRMISYGGSRNNISLLVKSTFKQEALEALNHGLFGL